MAPRTWLLAQLGPWHRAVEHTFASVDVPRLQLESDRFIRFSGHLKGTLRDIVGEVKHDLPQDTATHGCVARHAVQNYS